MPGLPGSLIEVVVARDDELARAGANDSDAVGALCGTAGGKAVLFRLARARCQSRPGETLPRSPALLRAVESLS